MARRIIVKGYHPAYKRKIISEAAECLGSLRKVAFALGIPTSMIYRWNSNETEMREKWVTCIEQLLKQFSSAR